MKNIYFFILFALLFFKSPCLFAEEQDLKKIKQELKELSDIRYENLIELKKEQRNINRRINRLQYSLKYRTDSIFNLISEAELKSGGQVSLDITEKNIKKNLNEDIQALKKELKLEISKSSSQKSGLLSQPLWFIVFGSFTLILTLVLFTLLYKRLNKTNNNLNVGFEAKEEEINKIKNDMQNESKQLNRSINNNRTFANQEIRRLSDKVKEEQKAFQKFIINNNIESLEMKCKLLSMEIKANKKTVDHSLAINIGNDLHKSKGNIHGYDEDWRRLESSYSNCGYEIIKDFGDEFKSNKNLEIKWMEDKKLPEGEFEIQDITKPIILFKKGTIQKGQITATKST